MKKFKSIKGIVNSKKTVFVKDKDGKEHIITFEKNELFVTVFIDGLKDVDIFIDGKECHTPANIYNKEWLIRECYAL